MKLLPALAALLICLSTYAAAAEDPQDGQFVGPTRVARPAADIACDRTFQAQSLSNDAADEIAALHTCTAARSAYTTWLEEHPGSLLAGGRVDLVRLWVIEYQSLCSSQMAMLSARLNRKPDALEAARVGFSGFTRVRDQLWHDAAAILRMRSASAVPAVLTAGMVDALTKTMPESEVALVHFNADNAALLARAFPEVVNPSN